MLHKFTLKKNILLVQDIKLHSANPQKDTGETNWTNKVSNKNTAPWRDMSRLLAATRISGCKCVNEISLGLVLHMVMGQRYEFRLAQMVLLVCAAIKVLLYVHERRWEQDMCIGRCLHKGQGWKGDLILLFRCGAHWATQIMYYSGYVLKHQHDKENDTSCIFMFQITLVELCIHW